MARLACMAVFQRTLQAMWDGPKWPPVESRTYRYGANGADAVLCCPLRSYGQPSRNFCQPPAEFHQADKIFNHPFRFSQPSHRPVHNGDL